MIKSMMEFIIAETADKRILAIREYEAYLLTGTVQPHGPLLTMVHEYRKQHALLEGMPLVNMIKDFALELYRYFANLYFERSGV